MPSNPDNDFRQYIFDFSKKESEVQTHTWFPPPKGIQTLHVPNESVNEFMETLYGYIETHKKSQKLETPSRGQNSFTEKINPDLFKLFVDIDFHVKDLEKGHLPNEPIKLQNMIRVWVQTYDQMIEDLFGIDYKLDRIVAVRLLYKIHLIYPSVMVNRNTATALAKEYMKRLQEVDDSFGEILTNCPKCIDFSVYNTGLRMLYMHKGSMGAKKKDADVASEVDLHEQYFGEGSYTNIYRTIDLTDFEVEDFCLETFKKSSIHVLDNRPLTGFLDSDIKKSFLKTYATLLNSKSRPRKGPSKGKSLVLMAPNDDWTKTLTKTFEFLKMTYCRTFAPKDVKLEGEYLTVHLNFSTECPINNAPHVSNRQYIQITKYGCSQKCYDELCRDKEWKLILYDAFPSKMKMELAGLGIGTLDMISSESQDDKEELQKKAVQSFFGSIRSQYPKSDLKANSYKFSDVSTAVHLPSNWCEVCKVIHDKPSTWFKFLNNGQAFFECIENYGITFPSPPISIDQSLRSLIFCNITFNLNLCDSWADVPPDFDREPEPIFPEDEEFNKLVFEALNGNHINIAAVIHYLGKERFAFSRSKVWYYYENHRWHPNRESALKNFMITTILDKFRIVRSYYEDNTIDQTLRDRRKLHINTKIIDKISNTRPQMDIIVACQTPFLENDFYRNGELHFEAQLDEKTNLLCFSNGILDLNAPTLELRNGHPKDFVTMCLNYDFPTPDPEKRAKVEKFFWDIMPEPEERHYLLLYISSLLHGDRKEEFYHIWTGHAGNGKSLLRDLLMALFGDYFENVLANLFTKERPGTSSPQPEIVKLKGKRAVFASEPEQNQKINTGFIKYITGGDPIKARSLNSNVLVQFKPHFGINLLANEIPPLDNSDGGTDRRTRVILFPVKFCDNPKPNYMFEKQIDVTLKETIIECKGDLLLMLLDYFLEYRDQCHWRLKVTPKMQHQTYMHKLKSNPVLHYMETMTIKDEGAAMHGSDLYNKFIKWCKIQRTDSTLGKNEFFEKLKENGCELQDKVRIGKKTAKGIVGRSWKDQEVEVTDETQHEYRNGMPADDPIIFQMGE